MQENLKTYDPLELEKLLTQLGSQAFRAQQIFPWMWQKGEESIENFSNLPKKLRDTLSQTFTIKNLQTLKHTLSQDGTIKFLLSLNDNHRIESVYIPEGKRKTVCVSTQVGCPIGCSFCATGTMGFTRNLIGWEIADQVVNVQKYLWGNNKDKKWTITNIVFMGMGEPMLNYEEVMKAVAILNSSWGPGIGARRITISTVGVIPGIYQLAEEKLQVRLAISLHTAIQKKREQIIPIAKKYPLNELKKACLYYYERKHRRITLEYIHLPGFNDQEEDLVALRQFIKDLPVKINLIPFNPYPKLPFRAPTSKEREAFLVKLLKLPCAVMLRRSRGQDIQAACGQLAV